MNSCQFLATPQKTNLYGLEWNAFYCKISVCKQYPWCAAVYSVRGCQFLPNHEDQQMVPDQNQPSALKKMHVVSHGMILFENYGCSFYIKLFLQWCYFLTDILWILVIPETWYCTVRGHCCICLLEWKESTEVRIKNVLLQRHNILVPYGLNRVFWNYCNWKCLVRFSQGKERSEFFNPVERLSIYRG